MLIEGEDLEWEDGTPVTGTVLWQGTGGPNPVIHVTTNNGADRNAYRGGRPPGYYNARDGGYSGSEAMFQKLRNAGPRGPEVYEEWFK